MLKEQGFSLFELLLCILLSSVVMLMMLPFLPSLHHQLLIYHQTYRLEQEVEFAMSALVKEIRRAGFIANHPDRLAGFAIEYHNDNQCILIRYDSKIRGDWVLSPLDPKNSDLFAYRYNKNNIEYKTGAVNCDGNNWEKMFDPMAVNVTHFLLKNKQGSIEIRLQAEVKDKPNINYTFIRVTKTENIE